MTKPESTKKKSTASSRGSKSGGQALRNRFQKDGKLPRLLRLRREARPVFRNAAWMLNKLLSSLELCLLLD